MKPLDFRETAGLCWRCQRCRRLALLLYRIEKDGPAWCALCAVPVVVGRWRDEYKAGKVTREEQLDRMQRAYRDWRLARRVMPSLVDPRTTTREGA